MKKPEFDDPYTAFMYHTALKLACALIKGTPSMSPINAVNNAWNAAITLAEKFEAIDGHPWVDQEPGPGEF